jgi:hypothetical protein
MAQHFPVVQPPGASSVPTFEGGTDSADLWLMQLKSYFHLAPNQDSDAKKICFASTRMTDQALMWYRSWLEDVEPEDLESTFAELHSITHFPSHCLLLHDLLLLLNLEAVHALLEARRH